MRKYTLILCIIVLITIICITGCTNNENNVPSSNNQLSEFKTNENYQHKEEQDSTEKFLQEFSGYWGYCNDNGGWEILALENGKISDYTYSGAIWISNGTIEKTTFTNNRIILDISYYEVAYGEEETQQTPQKMQYEFTTNTEHTVLINNDGWEYKLIGNFQEDAYNYIENFQTTISINNPKIPEIPLSSNYLGEDINTYIQGYSLIGPGQAEKSWAINLFEMDNINNVSFYSGDYGSGGLELFGSENGEIVIYGVANIDSDTQIKDYLNGNIIEPAKYPFDGSIQAYVWKIQNGYMILYTVPIDNLDFYNHYVWGKFLFVKDLSYLPYIN